MRWEHHFKSRSGAALLCFASPLWFFFCFWSKKRWRRRSLQQQAATRSMIHHLSLRWTAGGRRASEREKDTSETASAFTSSSFSSSHFFCCLALDPTDRPTDRPIHISSFATPRDDVDAAIYSRPVAVVYCYYYVPWAAAAAATV